MVLFQDGYMVLSKKSLHSNLLGQLRGIITGKFLRGIILVQLRSIMYSRKVTWINQESPTQYYSRVKVTLFQENYIVFLQLHDNIPGKFMC